MYVLLLEARPSCDGQPLSFDAAALIKRHSTLVVGHLTCCAQAAYYAACNMVTADHAMHVSTPRALFLSLRLVALFD
jgi:hypothetical protein